MQILNKKGETLYLVVCSSSKELRPTTYIKTWNDALELFNKLTADRDDEQFFCKTVKRKVREGIDAQAACIENHKGWGCDYAKYVEIKSLYYHEER